MTHHVAIVVFAEVRECADEAEAAFVARKMLRSRLGSSSVRHVVSTIPSRGERPDPVVTVVDVMEVSAAAASGSLLITPGLATYRRASLED